MRGHTDGKLIALAKDGDSEAVNVLLARYYDKSLLAARAICADLMDAEDLVQETFIKAWQGLPGFEEGLPFWPWLKRIMHNQRVNESRSVEAGPWTRRYYDPVEDNADAPVILSLDALMESGWDVAEPGSDPAQQYIEWEDEQGLLDKIDTLSPQQSRCLKLALNGYDYREIAELLDISYSTVRVHIARARQNLREKVSAV